MDMRLKNILEYLEEKRENCERDLRQVEMIIEHLETAIQEIRELVRNGL